MELFSRRTRVGSPPCEADRMAEISAKARAHHQEHGAAHQGHGGGLPLIEVAYLEVDGDQFRRLYEEFNLAGLSMLKTCR